ncbi:hypothetical protein [Acidovorax sp. NCPPB 4044]|uniref:hypothetical protein n=1 Tax=Acidovorax sp. NCPPB 4044 TaxID=2940490 RepID=UPI002303550E|nr:hypothetical protein [Acidovorax sp. NCPPB 4044]MDA8521773.1 hypothetical protein [Acidovorax sp. NCPPB 4044]
MAKEQHNRNRSRTATFLLLAMCLAFSAGAAPAKPKATNKPKSAAKARKATRPAPPVAKPASPETLLSTRIGVVDASAPGAALVALASADQPVPAEGLHYLPLSPAAKAADCCVRPQSAVPARDVAILRFDGDDAQLAAEHSAQFTRAPDGAFMGLTLQGKATVTRATEQRLFLQWPDRKVSVRVDHCFSAEGMHVRVADSAGPGKWQPAAYYYLPLKASVQPDCPLEE